MRWEALFADLEAQLEASESAELAAEVADRSRRETGRLGLADRLRAALGHPVVVRTVPGGTEAGRLDAVGPDWLLLGTDGIDGRAALVPLTGVLWVSGLGAYAAEPGTEGRVGARLDLRYALRGLARDRAGVTVVLSDGTAVVGTLDRVGADHVDLAEHPPGEPRRAAGVRAVRTIPLSALAVVRSV